jgi:glycosyltransferase involved in cell wall biosynthesis
LRLTIRAVQLRILLLIPSMRGAGGTERVVHNLAALLSGLGHEVAVATFDAPGDPVHFQPTAQLFPLGPTPRLPLPLRPFAYFIEARRLASLKRHFRADLTISNLWRADLISQLSGGADRKIAVAHINVVGNPTNRMMLRLRPLVASIYRRFARVVAVSRPLAAELADLYRLAPGQALAIDNFSDPPPATPCLPDDGVRRLLWCGRLVPEKNLAGLLDAWAAFCKERSQVQLVVLGDGPLRAKLTCQAAAHELRYGTEPDAATQVVFAGVVARPADYMVSARALLLSSEAEGMPMVLLEAIALGMPVIASDCPAGGVCAVLSDDGSAETGFGALLPIPRVGDIASQQAWLPWLARAVDDDGLLADWRRAALKRAERFSSATAAARWQAAIAEALA